MIIYFLFWGKLYIIQCNQLNQDNSMRSVWIRLGVKCNLYKKWILTASLTLEEAAEPPDAAELPPLAAGDGLFCEDVSIEVSEADLKI